MNREALSWLLLLLGSFSMANDVPNFSSPLQQATWGNKLFGTELYDAIRKNSTDNMVVSPVSVGIAAAMLEVGSGGETSTALRSAFHFPADYKFNIGYTSLIDELQRDRNVTLEMANKIFPAAGYKLNYRFLHTLNTYFSVVPQQLNYSQNVEAAGEINAFVSNSTHGKIRDLIDASDLKKDTKLVLVNAIYFKGIWKYQFNKNDTRKEEFYTSETVSTTVDMMKVDTTILYGELPELDATAVSLPYKGDRWSMIVLLPNKRTGLKEMEDKLKSVPLEKIIESMMYREVELYLPRFKLESTIDLKDPLTELGAGVMFDPVKANFTGIPQEDLKGSENLYVSKAVQKAFIEVNEEGSEAAAATGIQLVSFSFNARPKPKPVVRVDHPFYSMIIQGDPNDSEQTIPVFLQRVVSIPNSQ